MLRSASIPVADMLTRSASIPVSVASNTNNEPLEDFVKPRALILGRSEEDLLEDESKAFESAKEERLDESQDEKTRKHTEEIVNEVVIHAHLEDDSKENKKMEEDDEEPVVTREEDAEIWKITPASTSMEGNSPKSNLMEEKGETEAVECNTQALPPELSAAPAQRGIQPHTIMELQERLNSELKSLLQTGRLQNLFKANDLMKAGVLDAAGLYVVASKVWGEICKDLPDIAACCPESVPPMRFDEAFVLADAKNGLMSFPQTVDFLEHIMMEIADHDFEDEDVDDLAQGGQPLLNRRNTPRPQRKRDWEECIFAPDKSRFHFSQGSLNASYSGSDTDGMMGRSSQMPRRAHLSPMRGGHFVPMDQEKS